MTAEIISIATTKPTTISPDNTLGDAIEIMAKRGFRRLPVERNMELVGILTATDVLNVIHTGDISAIKAPVERFMTPDPISVPRNADLTEAIQLMFRHNIGSLPIIGERDQTLAGIATERDIVREFSDIADADLAEFITKNPITQDYKTTTVGEVISSMAKAQIRRAILVDGEEIKGIVTSTDIMKFLSDQIIRKDALDKEDMDKKAYDICVKDVYTVNISKSVAEVAEIFSEKSMGGVPVVDDDNKLVGIFTERDLLNIVGTYGLM